LALRLNEAAAAIGVSSRCLWDWVQAGIGPPCLRLQHGKKATLLFPVDGLQAWLRQQQPQKQEGQTDE
jgi:predicted DNA-binding transcriptional regulator AlpA